jgi:stage III sporulation protein AH
VIISALVVMIAVTGYLNLTDGNRRASAELPLTSSGEIMALIMDDMMAQDVAVVNTTLDSLGNLNVSHNPDIATAAEAGAAVFVNTTSDSSFFIQAKLNREQARSGQMSSLTEMINNLNIAQEQRAEKAAQLADILSRVEREAAAEALIEAKGFTEVYVRIGDTAVDIVVDRPYLTDQEIAQIVDVAARKTGFALDQIFISPLRQ